MKRESNSAFPHAYIRSPDERPGEGVMPSAGISVRDYFAAHAPETPNFQLFPIKQWISEEIVELGGGMRGLREVCKQESLADRAARWSHEYADAMIAERNKP